MKRVTILCLLFVCGALLLQGQCPQKDSLLHRMAILREDSTLSAGKKLNELQQWETRLQNCEGRDDSLHAALLGRLGTIHASTGEYVLAIDDTRKAIAIINRNPSTANSKLATVLYYILSNYFSALENRVEQLTALDSCIGISMRNHFVDAQLLYVLLQRTRSFYNLGDYRNCLRYAETCEKLATESGVPGQAYILYSVAWKNTALLAMNDYQSLEKIHRKEIEQIMQAGNLNLLGMTYEQLGELEMEKKNEKKALALLNRALYYEQQYGSSDNCRTILNNLGYLYSQKNDGRARRYYQRAYLYRSKEGSFSKTDSIECINALGNLANCYVREARFDSAFHFFQLAFDHLKPGINETGLLKVDAHEFASLSKVGYLATLMIAKGDAYIEMFRKTQDSSCIKEGISIYKTADLVLQRIKREQTDDDSKLFWRKDTRRLYENAIEACNLENNISAAFYFFERSRAVLLNDQLNEQRWMDETDILKQTQLKKSILKLEREYQQLQLNHSNTSALEDEVFSKRQELVQLEQRIKAKNPFYYQNFLDSSIITTADVQQKILKDHSALIEIFSGEGAVYALMVAPHQLKLIKVNRQEFDSLSSIFYAHLSNADLLNRDYNGFVHAATRLNDLIFGNFSIPNGRVIISPDGRSFPFEALMIRKNGSLNYFIEEHAVSYTYSARYLLNIFDSKEMPDGTFMGIAPVDYAAWKGLSNLTGSDRSLQRLEKHFNGVFNLLSADATRNNFLSNFYQYRIIQVYAHAGDSGFSNEPVIYFTDSALLLSDLVYEKRPATSLIVLSACETGSGEWHAGEGVFSFNRGFAALGIPSSISNLWEVNNAATYRLTELFYQYLTTGVPVDVALQKAKIDFIHSSSGEQQLPYYWAAPVLTGKTDAIEMPRSNMYRYLLFAGACILLVVVGLWSRKRTRTATRF